MIDKEDILRILGRDGVFHVTWRYRDDSTRKKCEKLRLYKRSGKGYDSFYKNKKEYLCKKQITSE